MKYAYIFLCSIFVLSGLMANTDPHYEADRSFIQKIKAAVKNSDYEWLAKHIDFPIDAKVEGKILQINNRKEFEKYYESIINRRVILGVWKQDSNSFKKNWQGVKFEDGVLWFTAKGTSNGEDLTWEYRIINIINYTTAEKYPTYGI